MFVLLGIVVVFLVWQSHDLVQYFNKVDPLVFEDLTLAISGNVTSQVSLSKQAAPSQVPENESKNENEWDLVVWSKKPMFREGVDSSTLVVSRKFSKEFNSMLSGMDEVIRVDFRVCDDDDDNCPTSIPEALTSDNNNTLGTLHHQYQRNKDRVLQFAFINGQKSNDDFRLYLLEAVTFWSDEYQQHIPVEYPRTRITVTSCSPKQRTCPELCPQNRQEPYLTYPYVQDPGDKVCKSSHPDTIPPNRLFGGACTCEATCFTPEAGALNSTWPWRDAAERELFIPQREKTSALSKTMLARWRKGGYRTYEPRFSCRNQTADRDTYIAPFFGDFGHLLFFIPEAKLIFCGIPKVGVTEWIKFFRHAIGAKDYLSLPHYKEDRKTFFMSTLDPDKAQEIMNDPSWTKAVFFRNPFERLLSAYEDKIVNKAYTQKVFHIGDLSTPQSERPVLTFAEFVDRIADNTTNADCSNPNGLGSCTDPHWKPQVMTCGLDRLLPNFDFIASFDHISEHTKILLDRVGIWEKHGRTFDDGKTSKGKHGVCEVPPPEQRANETVWGFNQRGPSGSGSNVHATNSQSKFTEYYTPELIEKVREAYALDFAVWDEISSKDLPADHIAKGEDLKVVQEYCASSRPLT
jgi:hypothetical protein